MADAAALTKLLDHLDRHVFQPVLNIDPQTIEDGERDAFILLQDEFQDRRDALGSCRSAEDLRDRFSQDWHSDWAIEARRGLARLGHPVPESVWHGFLDLLREAGLKKVPEPEGVPDADPELVGRIRERARALWERDGCPEARQDEYLERARELEAIAEHPTFGLMPNPATQADRRPSTEEPVEPIEAAENQADIPGALTDQGERLPEPTRDAWKNAD